MAKFFGPKSVPKFKKNYNKLPWYKRDLMTYYDHLKYQETIEDPNNYFKDKIVVNFDIVHHECRGDLLKKTYKEHKTIEKKILSIIPKKGQKNCSKFSF